MNSPILIACAHGTSSADGAAEVNALRAGIAALRPGLDVREAYVDVQDPELPAVVAGLPEGETAVVVPLLLSVGYHVKVDIARAVKGRPGTRAAAPLGPDPRLAALLDVRLREAGVTDNDAVILAAAGSSDPTAAQNVEELAGQLRALRSNRIVAAYGASAKPSVPDAVAMLREEAAGGAGAGESAGGVDLGGRAVRGDDAVGAQSAQLARELLDVLRRSGVGRTGSGEDDGVVVRHACLAQPLVQQGREPRIGPQRGGGEGVRPALDGPRDVHLDVVADAEQ